MRRGFLSKTIGVLSFLGGPLFWADALKPLMAKPWPFVITFVPVGVLLLAMVTLYDGEPPTLVARAVVWLGLVGCVVLAVMNLGALWKIVSGFAYPGFNLMVFGMVVGTIATAWYTKRAVQYLKTETERA